MAFGWIPEHLIRSDLASGDLVRLSLAFGGDKTVFLFMTLADENCRMSIELVNILKAQGSGAG